MIGYKPLLTCKRGLKSYSIQSELLVKFSGLLLQMTLVRINYRQ
jgi:hypothetical protein